jgi:hypothetical protein
MPPPSHVAAAQPLSRLDERDLIICAFGPQYYLGVAWGSGVTLAMMLLCMRRAYRNGMANVARAIKEAGGGGAAGSSGRVQAEQSVLDKYAPQSSAARGEFTRAQATKAKSMREVDFFHYVALRAFAVTAAIKAGKLYLSMARYAEFALDESVSEELTEALLRRADAEAAAAAAATAAAAAAGSRNTDDATARAATEPAPAASAEAARDLSLFQEALRLRELEDLRRVAAMQRHVMALEERQGGRPSTTGAGGELASDIVSRSQNPNVVQFSNDAEASSAAEAAATQHALRALAGASGSSVTPMPTFWDGVSVGVWGSLTDASVPSKPTREYLYLRAGKGAFA